MERREAEKDEKRGLELQGSALRHCFPTQLQAYLLEWGEFLLFRYSEPKIVTVFSHLQCMIPVFVLLYIFFFKIFMVFTSSKFNKIVLDTIFSVYFLFYKFFNAFFSLIPYSSIPSLITTNLSNILNREIISLCTSSMKILTSFQNCSLDTQKYVFFQ